MTDPTTWPDAVTIVALFLSIAAVVCTAIWAYRPHRCCCPHSKEHR